LKQWDPLENTVNAVEQWIFSLYEAARELGLRLKSGTSVELLLQIQGTFDCRLSLALSL